MPNRGNQNPIPEGANVGLGVRNAAIRNLHIQGALTSTGNKLDLAINGRGWFQIEGANGETFYTRAGSFNKNGDGQVVTLDGNLLQPPITVPIDATTIVVNETGEVFAQIGTQPDMQSLGQLTLANFANDAGLEPMGGNLYRHDAGIGQCGGWRAGRSELRHRRAGLPGALQRRSREGNHRADHRAALLRDELKVVQAVDEMYSTISRG